MKPRLPILVLCAGLTALINAANYNANAATVGNQSTHSNTITSSNTIQNPASETAKHKRKLLHALTNQAHSTSLIEQQIAQFSDMLEQATTLTETNKTQQELEIYNQLIEQYPHHPHPKVQQQVASALYNKVVSFAILEQKQQALATATQLQQRYADASSEHMQQLLTDLNQLVTAIHKNM